MQPADSEHRAAVGDVERARCSRASRGAGRFVPERTFDEIDRRARLERFRATHGAGLRSVRHRPSTAIKYSLNRYNLVTHNWHRGQLQPAAAPDFHAAVARRQRQRPSPTARCAAPATRSAALRNRRSPASSSNYRRRRAQRVRRLPEDVEPRDRASRSSTSYWPALSVSGILVERQLPQPHHDRQPVVDARRTTRLIRSTTRSPANPSRSMRAAAQPRNGRPGTSIPTTPSAGTPYRGVQFREPLAHPGRRPDLRRAWRSSGSASENCTSPDDPNYPSTTDERHERTGASATSSTLDIPFRSSFKLSGTRRDWLGHQFQRRLPEQQQPDQLAE